MFNGLQDLLGYVEWHLNVVISSMMTERGVSPVDLMLFSMFLMGVTWLLNSSNSNTNTLYNVAALMVASSFSRNIIQYITSIGGMDDITVTTAMVVVATAIIHMFK